MKDFVIVVNTPAPVRGGPARGGRGLDQRDHRGGDFFRIGGYGRYGRVMRCLKSQTEDVRERRRSMQRVTTCVNALSLTMRFWMGVPSTVIFPGLAALVKNHGLWLLFTLISALPSTSYN